MWIGLACLALLGVLIVRHYGEGVDEWHNAFYGWAFVHAYETSNLLTNPGIDYFNGPFFMMIWVVVSQALHWVISAWMLVDARHFTTFVTFLAGLWLLYRLCLRFVTPEMALLTTALFACQPLLFGHAFINQKDTPLMVFFLASVVAGWAAAERWAVADPAPGKMGRLADDWRALSPSIRAVVAIGVAGAAAILLDLWVFHGLLGLAEGVLRNAYNGASLPFINRVFERVATDAYKSPVELYIGKLDRAVIWLRLPASAALLGAVFWGTLAWFPDSAGRVLRGATRKWGLLVLAGMLVGMTTSIRQVGPLAGMLVVILLVWKLGRSGIVPAGVVGMVAVLTTYLTWPALWGDPIGQFIRHAGQTTEFTSFNVLYAGKHYESTNLPWHYLPWLLSIQLTLPAVVAILLGFGAAVSRGIRQRSQRLGLVVLGLWVGGPALAVIMGWVSIYNNFRHVLFILPPLFALAGMGLQWVFRIRLRPALKLGLAILLMVPGILGIVRLHPYEYIYYNELVGGVDGAAGRYEMDYWCTSLREAMEYIDEEAPIGGVVAVTGAMTSASGFARGDITLTLDRSGKTTPDLGLVCQHRVELHTFPDYKDVFTVRRGAAVLAVVKGPGG